MEPEQFEGVNPINRWIREELDVPPIFTSKVTSSLRHRPPNTIINTVVDPNRRRRIADVTVLTCCGLNLNTIPNYHIMYL